MRLAVGMTTMSALAPPEALTKRSRMRRSFSLFSAPPIAMIHPRCSPAGTLLGIRRLTPYIGCPGREGTTPVPGSGRLGAEACDRARRMLPRPSRMHRRLPCIPPVDGHAAKAKELLDKVNEELKMAAEAANKNHR